MFTDDTQAAAVHSGLLAVSTVVPNLKGKSIYKILNRTTSMVIDAHKEIEGNVYMTDEEKDQFMPKWAQLKQKRDEIQKTRDDAKNWWTKNMNLSNNWRAVRYEKNVVKIVNMAVSASNEAKVLRSKPAKEITRAEPSESELMCLTYLVYRSWELK